MRVQVGDIRIFFETYGAEWVLDGDRMRRRPVMLALHGGPGADATRGCAGRSRRSRASRSWWFPISAATAAATAAHPRHGTLPGGQLTSGICARSPGLQAPVVLGRSFGGFVAQQYAAAYPQHPSGLILMAASPRFPGTEQIVARFREVGGDHAAEVMRRELETPSDQTAAEWPASAGRCCRGPATPIRPARWQRGSNPPR